MVQLFDVGVNTINYHLKEVFESGEIQPEATIRKFRIVVWFPSSGLGTAF